jgi:type II secretory pathway pseudopilin PulG
MSGDERGTRAHRPGAPRLRRRPWRACGCGGFSYVFVLAMVAALSLGLSAVGAVWQTEVRRERERELLFVGQQYREALNRYAKESPAGTPRHPEKLEDLLLDRRSAAIRRHLRRPFVDPMTGKADWGLIRQNGRIVGVFSKASGTPLMAKGFPTELTGFDKAASYSEWRFVADNVRLAPAASAAKVATGPGPAGGPAQGPAPPGGPPPQQEEEPSIPTPPPPCIGEFDAAVSQCWSNSGSTGQNAACEAKAQRVYDACQQRRLFGPR